MKIRLAKKIMKQRPDSSLSESKTSLYWIDKWNREDSFRPDYVMPSKVDSRLAKAISLTSKISTIVDTSKKKKV